MPDPQTPYLVSGTIYTSRGKVPNTKVKINSDLTVLTDSQGQYVADLANLGDGYTAGATYTIEAWDDFDNEYVTDNITVSGESQSKSLFLKARTKENEDTSLRGRSVSVFSIGNQPVSDGNLVPVKTLERPLTQKLAYVSGTSRVEYVGEAAPGSPADQPKWRIKKFLYSGSNLTDTQWAYGNAEFDKEWTSRTGYTYS